MESNSFWAERAGVGKQRGRLIVFEGVEGAGKSTHLRQVAGVLRQEGWEVVETREPGGTRLGRDIRRLLMEVRDDPPGAQAELFLYLADRAQHVSEVIRPALAAGKVVLSDRFSVSTIAYQGFGRGLDLVRLRSADALARQGVWPDLILVLDCPVELGLQRAGRDDRFHREDLAFHEKVRAGFLQLAREDPHRFVIIDTTEEPARVSTSILAAIHRCLQHN